MVIEQETVIEFFFKISTEFPYIFYLKSKFETINLPTALYCTLLYQCLRAGI